MIFIIPIVLLFIYIFYAAIFFIDGLIAEDAKHKILCLIVSSLSSTCVVLIIIRIIILLFKQGIL